MVFVTAGTQAPFDRLIKVMDRVAIKNKDLRIVAQAVGTRYSVRAPNLQLVDFLPQGEFDRYFNNAMLIVSHAGTGSIFSALTTNKPIVAFPRIAALGEHRNEHQMATAKKFLELGLLEVAFDEEQLERKVIGFIYNNTRLNQKEIDTFCRGDLVTAVKQDIIS